MGKKPKVELVLWGVHLAHGCTPLKLTDNCSQAEQKRRTSEGWLVAVYRKGDIPTGLEIQAQQLRAKGQ